jgi:hypothetical protein
MPLYQLERTVRRQQLRVIAPTVARAWDCANDHAKEWRDGDTRSPFAGSESLELRLVSGYHVLTA